MLVFFQWETWPPPVRNLRSHIFWQGFGSTDVLVRLRHSNPSVAASLARFCRPESSCTSQDVTILGASKRLTCTIRWLRGQILRNIDKCRWVRVRQIRETIPGSIAWRAQFHYNGNHEEAPKTVQQRSVCYSCFNRNSTGSENPNWSVPGGLAWLVSHGWMQVCISLNPRTVSHVPLHRLQNTFLLLAHILFLVHIDQLRDAVDLVGGWTSSSFSLHSIAFQLLSSLLQVAILLDSDANAGSIGAQWSINSHHLRMCAELLDVVERAGGLALKERNSNGFHAGHHSQGTSQRSNAAHWKLGFHSGTVSRSSRWCDTLVFSSDQLRNTLTSFAHHWQLLALQRG